MNSIDSLYRVAAGMTRSPRDAEDLVAAAFERAAHRHDPGGASALSDTVALFRGLWTALAAAAGHDPARCEMPAHAGAAPADRPVMRALQRLPEATRAVVLLDLEGLGYGEIAAVLDLRRDEVASRLARARGSLREILPMLVPTALQALAAAR